jgi:hypothetical protein
MALGRTNGVGAPFYRSFQMSAFSGKWLRGPQPWGSDGHSRISAPFRLTQPQSPADPGRLPASSGKREGGQPTWGARNRAGIGAADKSRHCHKISTRQDSRNLYTLTTSPKSRAVGISGFTPPLARVIVRLSRPGVFQDFPNFRENLSLEIFKYFPCILEECAPRRMTTQRRGGNCPPWTGGAVAGQP